MSFCRTLAVIHSLNTTVTKIKINSMVTLGQASVARAPSSLTPMPPAPTKPNTVDSRMLMSQRNTLMPANVGATWGTTPQAMVCALDAPVASMAST